MPRQSQLPAPKRSSRNALKQASVAADVGLAATERCLQAAEVATFLADSLLVVDPESDEVNHGFMARGEDGGYTDDALKIQKQYRELMTFAGKMNKDAFEFLARSEDYMRDDEANAKQATATVETPLDRQAREAKERRKDANRDRKLGKAQRGRIRDAKATQAG